YRRQRQSVAPYLGGNGCARRVRSPAPSHGTGPYLFVLTRFLDANRIFFPLENAISTAWRPKRFGVRHQSQFHALGTPVETPGPGARGSIMSAAISKGSTPAARRPALGGFPLGVIVERLVHQSSADEGNDAVPGHRMGLAHGELAVEHHGGDDRHQRHAA